MRISGVEVPEEAKMVVMQEDKFKVYFNLLHNAINEYEEVLKLAEPIIAVSKNLLEPHLNELFRVIQPAMVSLTWTSMNIDAFLSRFHTELMRFRDLVTKMTDIMDNRIERNLQAIEALLLVELPQDGSMSLDKFVSTQEKHVEEVQKLLAAKNQEVEEAVTDLGGHVRNYTLSSTDMAVDDEAVQQVSVYYAKAMYRATTCTQRCLRAQEPRRRGRWRASSRRTSPSSTWRSSSTCPTSSCTRRSSTSSRHQPLLARGARLLEGAQGVGERQG